MNVMFLVFVNGKFGVNFMLYLLLFFFFKVMFKVCLLVKSKGINLNLFKD